MSILYGKDIFVDILPTSKEYFVNNDVSLPKTDKFVQSLCTALCRPPLFTTIRVHTSLDMCAETVRENLHHKLKLEYEDKGHKCPEIFFHPVIPDLLVIPGVGPLYQKKVEKEVTVDHSCGCAVLRGAHVYVQGVLGVTANVNAGDLVSVYADLDGRCLKGFRDNYTGRKVFVGNGVIQFSRRQLFEANSELSGIGVKMTKPLFLSPSLSDLPSKLVPAFPQNLPSMVTSLVLAPEAGEVVLDMCAAPGGKTSHIAAIMGNTGTVIALDKTSSKIERICRTCESLGVTSVQCYVCDSTKACSPAPTQFSGEHTWEPPLQPESMDRILLDAPCSALGQRPTLVHKLHHKQLRSYPKLQKQLFTTAVSLLRPGGVLVYSTCTVTLCENEDIVAWALNKFPQLELTKQEPHVGGPGYITESLSAEQSRLLQRFDPSQLITEQEVPADGDCGKEISELSARVNVDTIGFFIAKFIKK